MRSRICSLGARRRFSGAGFCVTDVCCGGFCGDRRHCAAVAHYVLYPLLFVYHYNKDSLVSFHVLLLSSTCHYPLDRAPLPSPVRVYFSLYAHKTQQDSQQLAMYEPSPLEVVYSRPQGVVSSKNSKKASLYLNQHKN